MSHERYAVRASSPGCIYVPARQADRGVDAYAKEASIDY